MTAAAVAAEGSADAAFLRRRRWLLAAMMLAMFMAAVEGTIVATAMPSIVADLGGFRLFTWVFGAFLLAQAVTTPLYGRLADRYGRKPAFFVGTGLFLTGSLLAGFAHSMLQLIAFRALQGLGAGAVQPIAMTVVGDLYTPQERARIQGFLSGVWGMSAVIGPVLGALFVAHLTWSLVFWINLPIGVFSAALLAVFLHEHRAPRRHRMDYAGAALLSVGVGTLMFLLIQGDALPAKDVPLLALLALLVIACLCALIVQERAAAEPIVPLDLWRNRIISVGNLGALSSGALLMGVVSFLPVYVQGVMGRSALVAGFTLTVISLGWPTASIVGGRLMLRTSYRFTAVLGGCLLVVGSLMLTAMRPADGPLWAATGSFLTGLGMGFSATTFLVSIQSSVVWEQRGVATSGYMFMRIVGQALGTAVFGAVLNAGLAGLGSAAQVTRLMQPGAAHKGALAQHGLAVVHALAQAMSHIYLVSTVLALMTLALVYALPSGLRPDGERR